MVHPCHGASVEEEELVLLHHVSLGVKIRSGGQA